jgi:hypothetical protein
MRRSVWLFIASFVLAAAPALRAQSSDHVEVGAFADYFRMSQFSPDRNFVGLGGRVAFNVRPSIQLEAEMAYDFKRNFTESFSNGVNTQLVTAQFRTLHGLFGPKFQTGSGPFRFFVTGKVGFDNFDVTGQTPASGFFSAVSLTAGTIDFAIYPGVGVEGFAGPFGLRAEIGDEVYFDIGAHNNLKITFGPQIRF